MSFWTDVRDTAESAGSVAGNYFLPGSGLITSQLVSNGAKQQLGSGLGQLAMLGSGLAGAGVGSSITGIPGSTGYSDLASWANSTPSTGLTPDATPVSTGTPDITGNTTTPVAPISNGNTLSSGSNIDTTAGPINPAGSPNAGGAANLPDNIDIGGGYNPASGGGGPTSPGFLSSLMSGNFGDAAGAAGKYLGEHPTTALYGAGSLYDMYAKNQMAKKQQDLYAQNRADILNSYAPGSAEYNALMNQMSRADAAAGRNSQVGARAVDIAGKIANYKTSALANMQSGQNTLANQGLGNQFGMFNTPLTLAALTATQK